ncbi:S8 family serine peptidase [Lentzea sp. NPDC058436]|uniref:S8 family peptidase n=1 Tax=Lentzea sp. NPDC058436 TaxID=3346499 RepID=UPI003656C1A8
MVIQRPDQPVEDEYADVPEWPRWALDRHRAKMLRPAEAVPEVRYDENRASVYRAPSQTVYLAEHLLMPQRDVRRLTNPDNINNPINVVLSELGVALEPPSLPDELDHLPFPVRIMPLDLAQRTARALPVVDAWPVLQRLREEAAAGGRISEPTDRSAVDGTSLEHLLVGAVLAGVPTYSPNGPHASVGGGYGAYPMLSPYGRLPAASPVRPQRTDVVPEGCRRPVVAVLDTGVAEHEWFGELGTTGAVVRPEVVRAELLKGRYPWETTSVLTSTADLPITTDTVSNDINSAYGHGTFIAGIIHQHAPDAEVVMMRVLRSDNVAHEGDVLVGLAMLPTNVDVIVLSLGYYSESVNAALYTSAMTKTIKDLVDRGVRVVAAAGNDATTRPFYPGALSRAKLVRAVGALNPNGTRAWFSNQGDYVTDWRPGACVISTYPKVTGSGGVTRRVETRDFIRETVDPDDYSNGFSMWSGTSFAAPVLAAELARDMGFLKT